MRNRLPFFIIILVFSFFLIQGCSGSRKGGNGNGATGAENQNKELDDIEALLGITPEESDRPSAQKPESGDEKLKLLETNEMLSASEASSMNAAPAVSPAEKRQMEQKISQLEAQLREKDLIIADLRAKNSLKDDELLKKSSAYGSSGSYSGVISDISPEEYQSRYDEGRSAFESRNYELAVQLFESLLSSSATHSLSDNAQFWIGESHYALRRYDQAIIDFEKVFTFANSNKKDDAQFKLGVCYLRKGDNTKAREEFQRVISDYPKSEYVNKVNKILLQIKD
ncbi:MAG: tol-pal system YbgF family protein [Calditrichaceae bacterium]